MFSPKVSCVKKRMFCCPRPLCKLPRYIDDNYYCATFGTRDNHAALTQHYFLFAMAALVPSAIRRGASLLRANVRTSYIRCVVTADSRSAIVTAPSARRHVSSSDPPFGAVIGGKRVNHASKRNSLPFKGPTSFMKGADPPIFGGLRSQIMT